MKSEISNNYGVVICERNVLLHSETRLATAFIKSFSGSHEVGGRGDWWRWLKTACRADRVIYLRITKQFENIILLRARRWILQIFHLNCIKVSHMRTAQHSEAPPSQH